MAGETGGGVEAGEAVEGTGDAGLVGPVVEVPSSTGTQQTSRVVGPLITETASRALSKRRALLAGVSTEGTGIVAGSRIEVPPRADAGPIRQLP